MKIIERNIALAKEKSQPICQDTAACCFMSIAGGVDQIAFEETARKAVTGRRSADISGRIR